jgi:hypothetical protein
MSYFYISLLRLALRAWRETRAVGTRADPTEICVMGMRVSGPTSRGNGQP